MKQSEKQIHSSYRRVIVSHQLYIPGTLELYQYCFILLSLSLRYETFAVRILMADHLSINTAEFLITQTFIIHSLYITLQKAYPLLLYILKNYVSNISQCNWHFFKKAKKLICEFSFLPWFNYYQSVFHGLLLTGAISAM